MNVNRVNVENNPGLKNSRQALGILSDNALVNRQKNTGPVKPQDAKQSFSIFRDPSAPSSSLSSKAPTSFPIFCDESRGNAENVPPPPVKTRRSSGNAIPIKLPINFKEQSIPGQIRIPLASIPSQLHAHIKAESQRPSEPADLDVSQESESMDVVEADTNTTMESSFVDEMAEAHEEERIRALDMVEYQDDCYAYLIESQKRYVPKWNYMTKQPDITFAMRTILVDWLVEVGEEYKLMNETIYLAVNYIDRFLSFMSVQRAKLQLVGTACMQIAAKYEEIYPPDVGEFVYITDDTYTKKQVLRMEHLVLKVINFDLAVPTPLQFVTLFSKVAQSDEETICLAQYLCELSLMDGETFIMYPANIVAAAAVALARHTLQHAAWPGVVRSMSKLSVDDFKECLVSLHTAFTNAPDQPQQAIREKYKQPKWHSVSDIQPVSIF